MIEATRVEEIFLDSLHTDEEVEKFGKEELTGSATIVEAIMNTFAFHTERLQSHKEEVKEMLAELPDQFQQKEGGGWSFLNFCVTKDGKQWTGLHLRMEQLLAVSIGLGLMKIQMPRELWRAFPGGMPYIVVLEEEQNDQEAKLN